MNQRFQDQKRVLEAVWIFGARKIGWKPSGSFFIRFGFLNRRILRFPCSLLFRTWVFSSQAIIGVRIGQILELAPAYVLSFRGDRSTTINNVLPKTLLINNIFADNRSESIHPIIWFLDESHDRIDRDQWRTRHQSIPQHYFELLDYTENPISPLSWYYAGNDQN